MNDTLLTLIYERLEADGSVAEPWSNLVMAACEGADELDAALRVEGDAAAPGAPTAPTVPADPPGAYLQSVTVSGFRGIGAPATLTLQPGPGLTLVVGRNGSGKSSFAEGLELLLTGDNTRWSGRSKAWQEGWQNLHTEGGATLEAVLAVEAAGVTTVRGEWAADADLDAGETTVQPHGTRKTTLDALGWKEALTTYRPFLSYNELGSMLDEGPSKLYDGLARVLGLDDLVDAEDALSKARRDRDKAKKTVKTAAGELGEKIQARVTEQADRSEKSDRRLTRCAELLGARTPDLDALEALLGDSTEASSGTDQDLLRQATLTLIRAPDSEAVTRVALRLLDAATARAKLRGTEAERAGELASLLQQAIDYHEKHTATNCPVCGRADALDASWRKTAVAEVARLHKLAKSCEKAERELEELEREARQFLQEPPSVLTRLETVGLDPSAAIERWQAWHEGRTIDDPETLATHLTDRIEPLRTAVDELVGKAREEFARREDVWRPIALELAVWLAQASEAARGAEHLKQIKSAEDWLKATVEAIRSERFAPIAAETKSIWTTLRHQSNVDLADVVLSGTRTKRRVELDVTVDGVKGTALGVMSQGELHAMALSLFLPRATLPESPFRFIVIDDPVQSMDPARVDGLARVLDDAAQDRQVVVFTHDDRLPAAVRRMGLAATVIDVARRAGSVVECRPAMDPVTAYLQDAVALVSTDELPEEAKAKVVPGFCRLALEAVFLGSIRRKRLAAGQAHRDVEAELAEASTLNKRAALALFDSTDRAGDVMHRLNQFGSWAGDVFLACKKGTHTGHAGDLMTLAQDTGRLTERLRSAL